MKQIEPDGSLKQWEAMRDLLWSHGLQLVFWHRVAKEWKTIGQLRRENERLKRELHKAQWEDRPKAWKAGYEAGKKSASNP